MPRRKAGHLVDLELKLMLAALGGDEFYGYDIARRIESGRPSVGHGSLYKALGRLEEMAFVSSRWEDAGVAERERRPRRRLYQITTAGETAVRDAVRDPVAVGQRIMSLG